MNLNLLQNKLLNAARLQKPDERVPYAFEKRIMAQLAAVPVIDLVGAWSRALWRAAIPCATVAMLFGIWTFASIQNGEPPNNLSIELEQTVFAGMHHHLEDPW